MKAIYRIEANDGHGMFCEFIKGKRRKTLPVGFIAEDAGYNIFNRHSENMDTPINDGLPLENTDGEPLFCAYRSMKDLLFFVRPSEMQVLIEYGYRAYKLHVSEWHEGNDQITFPKSKVWKRVDITRQIVNNIKNEKLCQERNNG